jgi:hypothetical protein
LKNYFNEPEESFWEVFPKNCVCKVSSTINISEFSKSVQKNEGNLTKSENFRAKKAIFSLKKGAPSLQKEKLGSCLCKNAISTYVHGQVVTDTVATWVEKDFVAGPFVKPPFRDFRVNRLVAVEQPSKIRPVLNLSEPAGKSFNDNINESLLEKVEMATEKEFGFLLKEAGVGAIFSKFDMKDAYKCIPAPLNEMRLQGFIWLNRFFFKKSKCLEQNLQYQTTTGSEIQ